MILAILSRHCVWCEQKDWMRARHRTVRSLSAFTLVELLIVVGIIAILIAILMPALAAARTQARSLRCLSNIRQLGVALRLYAADNQDNYPINVSSPSPGVYWNDANHVGHYIAPPSSAMDSSSVYWCPEDDGAAQSYAMNIWASSAVDKQVASLTTGVLWTHHRPAGAMILLAEAWSGFTGTSGFAPSPPTIGAMGTTAGQKFGALGGVGPFSAGRFGLVNCELTYSRHRRATGNGAGVQPIGRVVIFFDDGHAALCSDQDLVSSQTGQSTGLAAWSSVDYVRN